MKLITKISDTFFDDPVYTVKPASKIKPAGKRVFFQSTGTVKNYKPPSHFTVPYYATKLALMEIITPFDCTVRINQKTMSNDKDCKKY